MNRRELVKALVPMAAVPLLIKGEAVGSVIKIDPNSKYIVFINEECGLDPEKFCEWETGLPSGTAVWMVRPTPVKDSEGNILSRTLDETIRIFKVEP